MANNGERRSVYVIALVTACCLLGDSMLYIALPIYWGEAGLTAIWQVGVLLAVNRFVRLPLSPLVGKIYEKIPLKLGLLFAVVLSVITTVGYGLAMSFLVWVILRCMWGLAWSFLRIGGLSVVAIYGGENRGEVMGIYNGLYRLGSLVGMLVGGILVPFTGLMTVAISFGALSAIGALVLAIFLKGESSDKERVVVKAKRFEGFQLLKRHSLLMTSGFIVTFLIQGVFAATLSSLILYHYGDTIHIWGVMITAAALSGSLQALRWLWEPFLARWIGLLSDGAKGRQPYFRTSLLIGGGSFLLLAFPFTPILWIGITLITLIASTALTTLMDAIASDQSKEENTVRFFTYYTIIQDFGAACGPIVGYLILLSGNGYLWLYAGCALSLVSLFASWRWRGQKALDTL